jgi:hypothetical protein
MRLATLIVILSAMFVTACSDEYPAFEDRSDQVRIKHRIPSK